MKKLMLALFFLVSFTFKANAFYSNAYVQVQPLWAKATVTNFWGRPVICSGQVFGQTFYGNVFNSWMNSVVVWPGQHAYVYVYTNAYDRFVNAWTNIQCRWY